MSKQRREQQLRDLAALGLLAAVVMALLWPVTVGGKLLLPADMLMVMQPWKAHSREAGFERVQNPFLDAIQQHYPWRKFAAEQFHQGVVPLWNPHMNCGTPFVANNQSAIFYPETWLFALMPPQRAFGWAALLSLIMGSWFMYAFLRGQGLCRSACLAGTIPFVLCGFIIGWLLLPTIRAVPMWLPLMLLAADRTIQRQSLPWAAVCAAAVGLQYLAGHLHVSLLIMLVFVPYVIWRLASQWWQGQREVVWRGGACVAGAIVVGTAMAAAQLLPVMELAGMNPRKDNTFADLKDNAMVPAYLLTGLMPDLFGNPVDYNFWGWTLFPGRREYIETAWYVGLPTWLLIGAALAWRRNQTVWFWAGLWLGGVGLAWGTGLYWLLTVALPPTRQLPGVSRAVLICCIASAVLAAHGWQALRDAVARGQAAGVGRLARWGGAVAGVLVVAGGLGVWLYSGALEQVLPGVGTYTLKQMGRALLILGAAVGALLLASRQPRWGLALLLVVSGADLLYFAAKFTPEVPARYLQVATRTLPELQADSGINRMTSLIGTGTGIDRMPPNLTMAEGLYDVQGSDSLVFEGYVQLMATVPRDERDNPDPAHPVLDLLNCRHIITSLDLSAVEGYELVSNDETPVYRNREALPRAFIPEKVVASAPDEIPDLSRPRAVAAVAGGCPGGLREGEFQAVQVSGYEANRVTLTGRLPAARLLVLGDVWYPGWRVAVDGREQTPWRVDYVLRGVALDQPATQVEWVYWPASYVAGLFLSCVALAIVAGCLVGGRRR